VPLLINDRVDVAIAIEARGVHLGQTDMSIALARRMLPKGSIIGVSCNNEEHVRAAVENGVDYIGIGAVWGTQTKQLTSPIIGVRGVGTMLEVLDGTRVKAVAIGMSFKKNYRLRADHQLYLLN
jgi:thiamine-phosphate diphosphorylase/hydroxyethylthiazole kinase